MKKALAVVVLGLAALVAPLSAQAVQQVTVVPEAPIVFTPPTAQCTEGRAHFAISSGGQAGSAVNCLASVTSVACPAVLCQQVKGFLKLQLAPGRINAEATIDETFACADPACLTFTIEQVWSGTVTWATGAFRRLVGASLSGGGTALFDLTTFEILSLDEELVIG
jgi:hypothetical protein